MSADLFYVLDIDDEHGPMTIDEARVLQRSINADRDGCDAVICPAIAWEMAR